MGTALWKRGTHSCGVDAQCQHGIAGDFGTWSMAAPGASWVHVVNSPVAEMDVKKL